MPNDLQMHRESEATLNKLFLIWHSLLCQIFLPVVQFKCPSKQKFTLSLSQAVKHFLEYFCLHVLEIAYMLLGIILEQSIKVYFAYCDVV